MRVPREILIKDNSEVSHIGGGGQTGAAEVNRERRKSAQILSGTEGDKLKLCHIDFQSVAVKIVA